MHMDGGHHCLNMRAIMQYGIGASVINPTLHLVNHAQGLSGLPVLMVD
jgi:hypothetical protein